MGIDNGTGVVLLIVREFRFEVFGDIGGDEHSELIGVMMAAEDGCQYCGKGVLLMEKRSAMREAVSVWMVVMRSC